MPSPPTYPPAAQLRVLAARLAKIAKVPSNYEDDFCKRISETVLKLRKRDRRATGATPGRRLIEAASAARTLRQTFSRMNKPDRDWVEDIKQTQMQFMAGKIDNLPATIDNIAMLLFAALGKPSPPPIHLRTRSHEIADQMLRELVFGLLYAAAETGGRLTFDKNSGSGTLSQALDLLRDYLPKGLVPEPLRYSTIQRLKTDFARSR
jgi:hypothetical protein